MKTSISECLFTSVLPLFYPFWLDNFWLDHSFQRVLFQPAWMSIITEFVIFKDLGTFLGGGLGVGGWGVLVEASSAVAGEEGKKPAALAKAACHW